MLRHLALFSAVAVLSLSSAFAQLLDQTTLNGVPFTVTGPVDLQVDPPMNGLLIVAGSQANGSLDIADVTIADQVAQEGPQLLVDDPVGGRHCD